MLLLATSAANLAEHREWCTAAAEAGRDTTLECCYKCIQWSSQLLVAAFFVHCPHLQSSVVVIVVPAGCIICLVPLRLSSTNTCCLLVTAGAAASSARQAARCFGLAALAGRLAPCCCCWRTCRGLLVLLLVLLLLLPFAKPQRESKGSQLCSVVLHLHSKQQTEGEGLSPLCCCLPAIKPRRLLLQAVCRGQAETRWGHCCCCCSHLVLRRPGRPWGLGPAQGGIIKEVCKRLKA